MSADYSNRLSRYRSIVNGTFKNIYDRKSVDDTIYDFITDEYGKPENAEDAKALEELAKMFSKYMDEQRVAVQETAQERNQGGVRYARSSNYDFSKSFKEQIKDYKKGLFPKSDTSQFKQSFTYGCYKRNKKRI